MQVDNNRSKENWIAYKTLVRRELQRFIRLWVQTLIPPVITTVLYFLIFGQLIGQRIGNVDGVTYVDFIAPGLIMMSILINAYANVSSSFFSTKFHHNIEEQLVSPMPDALIILGFVTGGVFRGLSVGLIVTIVALFFTHIQVQHVFSTLLIAVLTAVTFSIAGFINGLYAKSFDDISIVPTFILSPLTYLGGVFYSITMLSPTWQAVAQFNPIFYVINGFRYGMLGISVVPFVSTIMMLLIFCSMLFYVSLYLMKSSSGVRK